MQYSGDVATIQQRMAETSDLYRRRLAVLDAVAPRPGERILEVGCGGGALLPMLGAAVGPSGRVVGIDLSADQITAARRRCEGLDVVETAVHDVHQLPYEAGGFDVVIAVQVIEYLDRPAETLSELRRLSDAHGRLVVLATNWDSMFWNCDAPDLTERVQAAWRRHAPHPNLPAELRPMLRGAGFRVVRQAPVTIVNWAYHEDAFAYWAARLMVAFGVGQGLISQADADAWLGALARAETAETFFFSSTPVLTTAVAA